MGRGYNYNQIRNSVISLVKSACFSKSNKYKSTAWSHHIAVVAKLGLALAKELKADKEIVELSAYLHDYSSIYKFSYADEHHVHSARMAKKILDGFGMPVEKIRAVEACILEHRGRRPMKKNSLESKILASADAMSHFTELADMMYLTYGVHKYSTVEGAVWLKNKLERSWKKIIPAGQQMIKSEHEEAMRILNQAINNKN